MEGLTIARILLAWERGRNQGYARRLRLLAEALLVKGHTPVLALREPMEAVLADLPVERHPAPFHDSPLRPGATFVPRTFACLLARGGFDDAAVLEELVLGWRALLAAVDPALVLAEFSPTLCLAAHGRLPVVQIGTGFTLPPADEEWFPVVHENGLVYLPQPVILDHVQAVQRRLGEAPLDRLTDFHGQTRRCLHGLEQLDPFFRRRPADPLERWVGPLTPLPAPAPLPGNGRYFAYLDRESKAGKGLTVALAGRDERGAAFIPGTPLEQAAKLGRYGMAVQATAPPFPDGIRDADWLVHHGGFETATAALALGRPQFMVPRNLAQFLTAQVLMRTGVAHGLYPVPSFPALRTALAFFREDPRFATRAQQVAQIIAARPPAPGVAGVIEACEEALGSSDG